MAHLCVCLCELSGKLTGERGAQLAKALRHARAPRPRPLQRADNRATHGEKVPRAACFLRGKDKWLGRAYKQRQVRPVRRSVKSSQTMRRPTSVKRRASRSALSAGVRTPLVLNLRPRDSHLSTRLNETRRGSPAPTRCRWAPWASWRRAPPPWPRPRAQRSARSCPRS